MHMLRGNEVPGFKIYETHLGKRVQHKHSVFLEEKQPCEAYHGNVKHLLARKRDAKWWFV